MRIIGGKWRQRKLSVPTVEGLRPTPDRVRETLFNWLQFILPGAKVLDLFSGTGILAFEALSRGASQVTLVEQSKLVCKQLQDSATKLEVASEAYTIINQDAFAWLEKIEQRSPDEAFDLVFLDPPYHQGYIEKILPILFGHNSFLKQNGLIYLESEKALSADLLPPTIEVLKSKKAGMVHYFLLRI